MAQFNSAEKISAAKEQTAYIQADDMIIESADVMTGDRDRKRFISLR